MRDLALLLFVAGTLPMALTRPIIGLLLWMMFSYLNPHRLTWGFAVGLPWVMVVAITTLVAVAAHPRQRQMPAGKPIVILMALFTIWLGISTTQATLPGPADDRMIQFVKMMIMAFITLMLVTDRQKLQWVIWVIVASFGFWGFKGGLFTLLTGGNYHVMGPESSFFTDNNAFALIMCMTIPLIRYVQLQTASHRLRIALWGLMGLTAVSVVGTYSRGGLLALAITGALLVWKSRRRSALILIVPAMALAIGAFMPEQYFSRIHSIGNYHQDASAEGRIHSWKFATEVALAHPFLGGGFDVWASDPMWVRYGPQGAVPGRAIHSIFFEVLGEQGFVGLGLFVSLLIAGYIGLARVRKRARAGPGSDSIADLASMMQVSLVAYVAAGALLPLPYIDFFYQLLAIIVVMQLLVERGPGVVTQRRAAGNTGAVDAAKPTARASRGQRARLTGLRAGSKGGAGGAQDLPPW